MVRTGLTVPVVVAVGHRAASDLGGNVLHAALRAEKPERSTNADNERDQDQGAERRILAHARLQRPAGSGRAWKLQHLAAGLHMRRIEANAHYGFLHSGGGKSRRPRPEICLPNALILPPGAQQQQETH